MFCFFDFSTGDRVREALQELGSASFLILGDLLVHSALASELSGLSWPYVFYFMFFDVFRFSTSE